MTEPLRGAHPGQATQIRCAHCQGKVLIVHADRSEARKIAALHLVQEHELGAVLLEGQDFVCEPAPFRCDLCCAPCEPPWWTYLTAAEARAEDPGWLVCDPCHELLQASRPLAVLVERSLRVQQEMFALGAVPEPELRATIKTTLRNFLAHVQPNPVRDSVEH